MLQVPNLVHDKNGIRTQAHCSPSSHFPPKAPTWGSPSHTPHWLWRDPRVGIKQGCDPNPCVATLARHRLAGVRLLRSLRVPGLQGTDMRSPPAVVHEGRGDPAPSPVSEGHQVPEAQQTRPLSYTEPGAVPKGEQATGPSPVPFLLSHNPKTRWPIPKWPFWGFSPLEAIIWGPRMAIRGPRSPLCLHANRVLSFFLF